MSGKASDIFSSLDSPVSVIVPQKILPKVTLYVNLERQQRRFLAVQKKFRNGKHLTTKQVRRYIRIAKLFGEAIPDEVLKMNKDINLRKRASKKAGRKRKPQKYATYINSVLWTKRKNQYYKIHGRRCAICGSVDYIHLHHKYYGEYGSEKDEHLVPLCKQHHEEFHLTLKRTKKDMIMETDTFIANYATQHGNTK